MLSEIIVACGSRDWSNRAIIERYLQAIPNKKNTIIRVGGQRNSAEKFPGADELIEKVALKMGFMVEVHRADWNRYGKRAGFKRNTKMLDLKPLPNQVVAFWDGESHGTLDTITKAISRQIPTDIVLEDIHPGILLPNIRSEHTIEIMEV